MLKVQKNSRFLIILTYFERPNMVRNALYSIVNSNYNNWHVAFYDDGSKTPGEPIAKEILGTGKVTFYRNQLSQDEKLACGGNIGENLNGIIRDHINSDVCLMLADDDALHPNYMTKLDDFFTKNRQLYYAKSFVSLYNPMKETYFTALRNFKPKMKDLEETPLGMANIAWVLEANKFMNLWFPERGQKGWGKKFIDRMTQTGAIWQTGDYGQFKGIHPKQLGKCDHRWAMSGGKLDCDHTPKLPENYAVDFRVDEGSFS